MDNFLGIEDKYCQFDHSVTVVIPVPFERTTSYGKGTLSGPRAIIDASQYVEFYDEQLNSEAYKHGIFTELPIKTEGEISDVFREITNKFSEVIANGKFVVGLGGEHTISFPIYQAFHEKYNDLSIVQFDAHSDLRDSYEDNIYSHASVMRRIYELNQDIIQIGIRSQCIEEAEFIKKNRIKTHYAHHLKKPGLAEEIINTINKNVFLTIDVDYFDPSIMPSTGTPEPGGFYWDETIDFLAVLFKKRNVVGFDVVELCPQAGLVHPNFLAAKLVYKLITLKMLYKV